MACHEIDSTSPTFSVIVGLTLKLRTRGGSGPVGVADGGSGVGEAGVVELAVGKAVVAAMVGDEAVGEAWPVGDALAVAVAGADISAADASAVAARVVGATVAEGVIVAVEVGAGTPASAWGVAVAGLQLARNSTTSVGNHRGANLPHVRRAIVCTVLIGLPPCFLLAPGYLER